MTQGWERGRLLHKHERRQQFVGKTEVTGSKSEKVLWPEISLVDKNLKIHKLALEGSQ